MTLATITIASHHFVITRVSARMRNAINEFSRTLIQYSKVFVGRGRPLQEKPHKVFAASTDSRTEFRYHINHLKEFKKVLYRHRLDDHLIEWKEQPKFVSEKIDLKIQPHLTDRPHQVPAVAYITNPESPLSKMVAMQAGRGKTYTAMRGASILADRICVMISPTYIPQWVRDFKNNCDIDPKRILTIGMDKNGTRDLKQLLMMAEIGHIPYDVIIISTATFRVYIDKYEQHEALLEEEGYVVPPHKFFEHIKTGLRIIDEVHENFHFHFKLDLYTNVLNSVSLSATLFADDTFVNKMMQVAYPIDQRYDTGEFDRYVTAYSLLYSVRVPSEIKTLQRGMGSYSHIEFEKSIMKYKKKVEAYFTMVRESMKFTYDLDYRPGNRCLVYFASIEMCNLFVDWIRKQYPDKIVNRFVGTEGDPYTNLTTSDISVSTVRSAGTGKDIPDLTTVILTVAINSSPSNLQGFGRLRDLKDGRAMYFVYFCCEDFGKHLEYHERKMDLLKYRALTCEKRYYGTMI